MKNLILIGAVALAGCGEFEDPAIVLDLRTLAMISNRPEQVIEFDPANPPDPSQVDFQNFTISALVADPAAERQLAWEMTLCAATTDQGDGRCAADHPAQLIGSGVIEDPDTGAGVIYPSVTFQPVGSTFVLLEDAIAEDPFAGFSGIDLEIQLHVAPMDAEGGRPAEPGVFAAKRVRFAAKIPAERTPNQNPQLDRVDWDTGGPAPIQQPVPDGRCSEYEAIEGGGGNWFGMTMYADQVLSLMPVEADGARETYVVPTFDGTYRTFTENIGYQWLATDGEFKPPTTGGPKDPFGNDPPLHTEWTPPSVDEITSDHGDVAYIDVPIWVVWRDERLGAGWKQSCVRVLNMPAPPT